ncbi:1-acyl-sn-glycerol-3-phosphate acyltransferase [Georgenia sp. 311]|uniref:1-acyl-sn-glycerol-3-phosphate acyltransferase n=1 Tax=Georgenia wutianyii TaxID=2585135 RepID=A0ABX5VMW7_9MICO|nr:MULTISPECIES: lysophospholipid acyltransferase family protein [Georgenia]QDB79846.1 1-acyl-sn-glycerol-3-phosphate acyltransferase [Georgenia wutianyii]TNC18024.1 1-acyl-sn-glycerol-3-phosphate acyltransferase [Georgenia sp. 311]
MARPVPLLYTLAAGVLRPILRAGMRVDWRGAEHLPAEGGFIAAGNHLTNLDALVLAHFLYNNGAAPRFLAKHSLFKVPVLGWALRKVGQIPVRRNTSAARESLEPARQALADGLCVGIFPEGTFTRDPDLWPMTARSGVGRLALSVRVPVIPVALWGVQDVLAPFATVPHPVPRRRVTVYAGPPVDLDDLYDRAEEPEAHREATARIMATLTAMLAELREAQPPARPYDIRRDGDPRAEQLAARAARKAERRAARRTAA